MIGFTHTFTEKCMTFSVIVTEYKTHYAMSDHHCPKSSEFFNIFKIALNCPNIFERSRMISYLILHIIFLLISLCLFYSHVVKCSMLHEQLLVHVVTT